LFYLIQIPGQFTGNKRSAFPFTLASQTGQTIFSIDSVPENFILSDPDHLNIFQINALYGHWHTRQNKKLQPFIVLNASPNHVVAAKTSEKAKGKQKMPYVDVSDSDGEMEVNGMAGGDEGEDAVVDDDFQDMPLGSKIGPPIGSWKVTPPSTHRDKHPALVAGPSKLGSGKQSLIKKDAKAGTFMA
jgi:hypothetical protein